MIPKTLSSTSLLTAEGCLRRFHAENILKTPGTSGDAAMRGSVVHEALEPFFQKTVLDKTLPWEWDVLETFLMKAYKEIYTTVDLETEAWKDCRQMAWDWFNRTDLSGVRVIEVENKKTFDLQTSIGAIPFTYILDRLDELSPGVYRVVDYKSIRAWINPEDLFGRIQARAYALAIQIEYPEATEIWVEFDMLRHEPISVKFTREDNAKTWYMLKEAAERIIACDDSVPDNIPETINNECMYCIRRSECDTLLRHEAGGGMYAKTGDDAVRLKLEVSSRLKALKYLEEELDKVILTQAEYTGEFNWSVDDIEVKISARANTKINTHGAARALGPELFERYGNLTVTSANALLKSGELSDEQAEQLKSYMTKEWGDPKPKVTKKKVL